MITRRGLLLAAFGLAGLAGLGLWGFGRAAIESEIAAILRRRLAFLALDEAGVRAFAHDQAGRILAKRMSMNRIRYHLLSNVMPTFGRFQRSTDRRSRVERAEDLLVSTYLVSSDFFYRNGDESRTVLYIAYYDALAHPCSSPFARPVAAGAG